MTTIIKLGKSSLNSITHMQKIIEQVKDFDDDLVLVLSAQGNTKKRLGKAIEDIHYGLKPKPESVFYEFERSYEALGSKKPAFLVGYRDSIYKTIEHFDEDIRKNGIPEYFIAYMKLFGETLSCALFSEMLNKNGIYSETIGFNDSEFPLAVRGDYLHASIDFKETKKRASEMRKKRNNKIIILPGGGGIDPKERIHKIKELGHGGTDTAACAYLYAFEADNLYIATNTYGMLDIHEKGKTVEEMDFSEVSDSVTFGAKLPGSRSLQGVRKFIEEYKREPEIRIVNSQDMEGRHTRIVKDAIKKPVKLVAGRDITLYEIHGSNLKGIHNALEEYGLEHTTLIRPGYARILVPSTSENYADLILKRIFIENGGKPREVKIEKSNKYSLIGAVGNGMENQTLISMRGASALGKNKINIRYNEDPGSVSIGYVIPREYMETGIRALYNEFIGRK